MLDSDDLDVLLKPVIDRQNKLTVDILNTICARINEIGTLSPSDIHKLGRMVALGADARKINAEIARVTLLNERQIQDIIYSVALDNYIDAKPLYDYKLGTQIPFKKNTEMQKMVLSIARQTAGTYRNLSQSTGFMLRDKKNPKILKQTPLSKAYQSIIDEAVQAAQSGVKDYGSAIRNSLKQLLDSGIRVVTYTSEKGKPTTQRIEVAVRRNILDGIRAINQGVQDLVGEQVGADGKELSVHAFSAPDHEPFQGHQFTNEEYEKLQNEQSFKDVNGQRFGAVRRPIGVWNCRHFSFSILVGITKPNYTLQQLNEINAKNDKGITLANGKHLTMYECTQYQRMLERKVRKAKIAREGAKTAGNEELEALYKQQLKDAMNEYNAFCKRTGLKPKLDKLRVAGIDR